MNNELYAECVVKRKSTPASIMIRMVFIVGVVSIFFFSAILGYPVLMLGVAAAFLVVWYWPRFNIEWEYVFCDGQLDFDMIMGGSKRKTELRIDFESVELVARQQSHALDAYREYKKKDFTSLKRDIQPYVIIAKVENEGYQLLFEPSQKMLDVMKNKSPRKVMLDV